jgi:hypothetical protein
MDGVIDWGRYPAGSVSHVYFHECDYVVENRRGLWFWRGNTLVGRVAIRPARNLTPELMRAELADLQRRIDEAASSRLIDAEVL